MVWLGTGQGWETMIWVLFTQWLRRVTNKQHSPYSPKGNRAPTRLLAKTIPVKALAT